MIVLTFTILEVLSLLGVSKAIPLSADLKHHVCEGDTGHIQYAFERGYSKAVTAVYISKISPEAKSIVSIIKGTKESNFYDDRAGMTWTEHKTGDVLNFRLRNMTISDAGSYEIFVYRQIAEERSYKDIKLIFTVLDSSGCPSRQEMSRPEISYRTNSTSAHPLTDGKLELEQPGNITLIVQLPRADPTVRCNISTVQNWNTCSGQLERASDCETSVSLREVPEQTIIVTITFIAYEPCLTHIQVYIKDVNLDTTTWTIRPFSFKPSAAHKAGMTSVLMYLVSIGAMVSVLFLFIYLCLLKRDQDTPRYKRTPEEMIETFSDNSIQKCRENLKKRYRKLKSEEAGFDAILIETSSEDSTSKTEDSDRQVRKEMNSCYVNLNIKAGHEVKKEDIFTHSGEKDAIRSVLVLGIGGIGKTTFSKSLAFNWAYSDNNPSSYSFLFLFECKKYTLLIKNNTLMSLNQLLQAQCLMGNNFELPQAQDTSMLVIVDGIDELAHWGSLAQDAPNVVDPSLKIPVHVIIYNIVHGYLLPNAKVLVLSRPTKGIDSSVFNRVLRLKGFDDESLYKCILSICEQNKDLGAKVQKLLEQRPILRNHCFVPMNCDRIGRYLKAEVSAEEGRDNIEHIETSTQVSIIILGEILRKRLSSMQYDRYDVFKQFSNALKNLSAMAAKGMREENCRFLFDQIDMEEFEIGSKEWESGLIENLSDEEPAEEVSFIHAALQQFLAAVHIAMADSQQFPRNNEHNDQRQLQEVQIFTLGLLSDKGMGHKFLRTIDKNLRSEVLAKKADDLMTALVNDVTAQEGPLSKALSLLMIRGAMEGKLNPSATQWSQMNKVILDEDNTALILPKMPGGLMPHHLADISRYLSIGPDGTQLASGLRRIDLSNNGISNQGLILLSDGLSSSKILTGIRLQGNNISDLTVFKDILVQNKDLDYLSFGSNKLDDKSALVLRDALSSHKKLKRLRMQNNKITAVGLNSLGNVLKNNTNLRTIDIGINQIDDTGVTSLGTALAEHEQIQDLRLGANKITEEGIKALLPILEKNTYLQRLWLQTCHIHDGIMGKIVEKIQNHKEIELLSVFGNEIGDQGAQCLFQLLDKHVNLRINMEENKLGINFKKVLKNKFGDRVTV